MRKFDYVIKDEVGIHARPATELVKESKKYSSTITITKGDKSAVSSRLMAVMSLGVKCGDTITVSVEGDDEDIASERIKEFFESTM